MEYKQVTTEDEIAQLATMADEIWHEYWPSLIGIEQTDYMVDTFQSARALTKDINENGYLYWFLIEDGRFVGYTGARPEAADKLFISKIYLYASERGKGYASQVIRFYEEYCRQHGIPLMYLTVNKDNELGIRAYKAKGFSTVKSVETNIGSGYIMDDYIMEKVF